MVRGVDFAAVDQFADVTPVLEKMVEPSLAEPPSPNYSPTGQAPGLGLEADSMELLEKGTDRPNLQILLKYPPDRLGLVRHDDEFLILVDKAEGN